ncbi:MAG: hypothetical protein ACE5FW_01175 [Candidatus Aenigmatarchaeota archaeon]
MVTYVRHLRRLMDKAGAEYNWENKQLLDKVVREVLGMEKADAEDVWKKVKGLILSGESPERKQFEEEVVKRMVKRLITG